MRKAQSAQVLDEVMRTFSRRITFVRFDSYTAQQNLMDPHKSLSEALDKYGTQDPKQTVSHRGVAAYALDLREDIFKETPRIITLDTKGASNEDLLAELVSHFNTQLRWLLVSACESYFIFIKEIYYYYVKFI